MKREWKESMGEISGFGGGYEAVCRAMVLAGIQWIDDNPDLDVEFKGFRGVYGLVTPNNEAAKSLEQAMLAAPVYFDGQLIQERVEDDYTGAMHHAAINHVLVYKNAGWDEYVRKLEERELERKKNES